MEVILRQDIKNLGDKDDVVKVRDGYARNFLIPQGLAILATESSKKVIAENKRQASHKEEHIKNEASKQAELLRNITVTIETLIGNEGKLFGSVTSLMIANQLKEKGFDVDRRRITFNDEIKFIGNYTATISLHKEVKVDVAVEVIAKKD